MNKKGLEFKLAFFAIAAFSMVIIAVGFVLSEWNDFYDAGLTQDLSQFDKLNEISAVAQQQQQDISPQSSDPNSDFEARSFRGGFGVINSILNSFGVLFGSSGMLYAVAELFGIPTYIVQTIVVMIMFSVFTAIIAILFRLTRSNA